MTQLDPILEIANFTRMTGSFFAKDLNALSDEAYLEKKAETCRTMQDIVAECVTINQYMVAELNGETFPEFGEATAANMEAVKTRAAGMELIASTANALADATLTNRDKMGNMTMAPWKEEITLFMMLTITAANMMYHDGQVTYLQQLGGDDKMHWFDEA
jgi:uncharacterized damage-inducible protein DinB